MTYYFQKLSEESLLWVGTDPPPEGKRSTVERRRKFKARPGWNPLTRLGRQQGESRCIVLTRFKKNTPSVCLQALLLSKLASSFCSTTCNGFWSGRLERGAHTALEPKLGRNRSPQKKISAGQGGPKRGSNWRPLSMHGIWAVAPFYSINSCPFEFSAILHRIENGPNILGKISGRQKKGVFGLPSDIPWCS